MLNQTYIPEMHPTESDFSEYFFYTFLKTFDNIVDDSCKLLMRDINPQCLFLMLSLSSLVLGECWPGKIS